MGFGEKGLRLSLGLRAGFWAACRKFFVGLDSGGKAMVELPLED